MEISDTGKIELPITWDFGGLPSRYATNILVQAGEHEIFLAFFEIRPPVLFSEDDSKNIESVNAECVARVVVSAEKMQSFINAMQQILDRQFPKAQTTREE